MTATVGALLTSSHRRIALFGAANMVVVPLLLLVAARAFTSLWCLWAAVASAVIADHVWRDASADQEQPPSARHHAARSFPEWLDRIRFRTR